MLAMARLPQRRVTSVALPALARGLHCSRPTAVARPWREAGLFAQRRSGAVSAPPAAARASPLRTAVRRKTTESAEKGAVIHAHAPTQRCRSWGPCGREKERAAARLWSR
jgi:hypothetical protein